MSPPATSPLEDPPGNTPQSLPKVSVLMITYNQERFISQAIESALDQDVNFGYEIVIGEDCSKDRTREIAINYQRQHPDKVRLFLRGRNLGVQRNLIETLAECRGEYVAFLEGDDYWTSHKKLQTQAEFLDSHPECTVCFHNVLIINDDGNREPRMGNPVDQKRFSTLEDLWPGDFIYTVSAMFRKKTLEVVPAWLVRIEGIGMDHAIWILNALRGKIGYLDEVMAVYREHAGGVWSRLSKTEQLEQSICFYENLNANLEFAYDRPIRRVISDHYRWLAKEDERCHRKAWRVPPAGSWLYGHPILYLLLRRTDHLVSDGMWRLRRRIARLKRRLSGWPLSTLKADPNPIQERAVFGLGVTTLSWVSKGTETAEVRVGAPNGPLLGRGGAVGSATTGSWVGNGMIFYLQDVSGEKPLTSANTLDAIKVKVVRDTAASTGIFRCTLKRLIQRAWWRIRPSAGGRIKRK